MSGAAERTRPGRHAVLPPTLAPIGLSRPEAAAFIGVSLPTFTEMVQDGRMPQPKCIGSRRVWNRREVEASFAALPDDGEASGPDPWATA